VTRKQKIASLLKRIQFLDLSAFVATPRADRENEIRAYVDRTRGVFKSYEPFRKCVNGIYGVSLGLDPTPPLTGAKLEYAVRKTCEGKDEGMNLSAAFALVDLLSSSSAFSAYHHVERSLPLGTDRRCAFRIEHYLVRDGEAIFQFPYPRRKRLSDHQLHTMMSLIHFAYATGDYSDAAVEIADLSAEQDYIYLDGRREQGPRCPRIVTMPAKGPLSREMLQEEVQNVHDILMRLSEE